MFLKRRKEMNAFLSCKRRIVALLAVLLILGLLVQSGGSYAEIEVQAAQSQKVHQTEKVIAGQFLSKTYDIDLNQAGSLVAKINAKGIGCKLLVIIYGSNSEYFLGHYDQPMKELGYDVHGNVKGSVKTDHIMMSDQYHLLVQSVGTIKGDGTITVDFSKKNKNVEDCDYSKIRLNNTKVQASEYNINNKKTHHYLLSGYREQKDLVDCYRFAVNRTGYVAIRTKEISNPGKVPYGIYVYSLKDNQLLTMITPAGKSLKTKLLKLDPGDYCVEVMAEENSGITNHQILYSLYVAKATNITSVKLNKKSVKLYTMTGYRNASLSARIGKEKAGSDMIRYRSSKASVVSVSKTGKLKAKKSGKAVITCYAIDKPSVTAKCKVVVKKPRLKLLSGSRSVFVGKKIRVSVKKTPKKQKVSWKSTNSEVASVNAKGVVTAKAPGTAKIYATSTVGARSASCTIRVKKKPQPKPKPKPEPDPEDPNHEPEKIAPVLSVSSAHLSPGGSIVVSANLDGGNFSVSGGIKIKSRRGRSCVVVATTSRGYGTVTYAVNGKRASKAIIIY